MVKFNLSYLKTDHQYIFLNIEKESCKLKKKLLNGVREEKQKKKSIEIGV